VQRPFLTAKLLSSNYIPTDAHWTGTSFVIYLVITCAPPACDETATATSGGLREYRRPDRGSFCNCRNSFVRAESGGPTRGACSSPSSRPLGQRGALLRANPHVNGRYRRQIAQGFTQHIEHGRCRCTNECFGRKADKNGRGIWCAGDGAFHCSVDEFCVLAI
jgi:hypothetical protein